MDHEVFESLHNDLETYTRELLFAKGESYAPESDRLLNFKKAASLQNCSAIEACFGMMAKHLVSISDLVRQENENPHSLDVWQEKLSDTINYCYLLYALKIESTPETSFITKKVGDFLDTLAKASTESVVTYEEH